MSKQTIVILGAGSWGTAVAVHLARHHPRVFLWGRNQKQVNNMANTRQNSVYLPGVVFPSTLTPTTSLEECVFSASDIIIAVPSHAFAEIVSMLPSSLAGLSWLTKGLDPNSHKFLSHIVADKWGVDFPVAVIAGPSFAMEVAHLLPTALTIAGNHAEYLTRMLNILHHDNLRVYLTNDMIGVQLCGAVKNVLAIACGVSDGLRYGANARAALITRGLAEMSRLGTKLGARQDTFMGLAGVGDLVLTCTDDQSRNRRFGLLLGQGVAIKEAVQRINQVVEGQHNAAQVCLLAKKNNVDMPICHAVQALLAGSMTAAEAVEQLMNRPPREE